MPRGKQAVSKSTDNGHASLVGRIEITLVADLSDLSHYWPDKPPGITRESIVGLLHDLLVTATNVRRLEIMKREARMRHNMNFATADAILEQNVQDTTLAKRLVDSIKIEIE